MLILVKNIKIKQSKKSNFHLLYFFHPIYFLMFRIRSQPLYLLFLFVFLYLCICIFASEHLACFLICGSHLKTNCGEVYNYTCNYTAIQLYNHTTMQLYSRYLFGGIRIKTINQMLTGKLVSLICRSHPETIDSSV